MRLDLFMVGKFHISRNKAQGFIKNQQVLVNGQIIHKPNYIVTDEIIELINPDPSVKILYECQDYLIVHKPPNLSVCRSATTPSNYWVLNEYMDSLYPLDKTNPYQFGLINRLDKDTSGLIMLIKHGRPYEFFKNQVSSKMKKYYMGFTQDYQISLTFHQFICPHGLHYFTYNLTECICQPKDCHEYKTTINNKPAITLYKPASMDKSHWEYIPVTGRTHQIRLMMKDFNQPIFNDQIYGQVLNDKPMGLYSVAIGICDYEG